MTLVLTSAYCSLSGSLNSLPVVEERILIARMPRICSGDPNSWVELLFPQGSEVRLGWAGNWGLGAETYPVQGDIGNLETQNDDPDEAQDERLVSVHDVLWPDEGYRHLWAQLAGLSHEALMPEKTQSSKSPGGQLGNGRVLESVPPQDVPKGEAGRAQGQASEDLSVWGLGLKPTRAKPQSGELGCTARV